jgi:aspartyl-tRNA(Asn)/glutamyl-tRNA(Gln) amidotransferase subunit C
MSISVSDVDRIARLARLRLEPGEKEGYVAELNRILELVEKMNAVATEGVEPLSHPGDMVLRLRPDEVTEQDQRDSLLAIAPAVEHGLYLVPKVIE